ncbi:MAG: leucine-rich repeat protein [Candidatus Thorarchaeota archaeon]|nr:leucine-rich repeat protein [Candidatus Thorarchaeota archaeon]
MYPKRARKFRIAIKDGIAKSYEIPQSKFTMLLDNSEIESIDLKDLSLSPSLVRLSLSENQLTSIDLVPLSLCKNVTTISLDQNMLETIDLDPLRKLRNLKSLDLSNNHLTLIDLSSLSPCKHLQELYLHGNNFNSIDLSPLASCQKLETLSITRRKDEGFQSSDSEIDISPLIGLQKLKRVDIAAGHKVNVGVLDVITESIPQGLKKFKSRDKKMVSSTGEFSTAINELGFEDGFRFTEAHLERLSPEVFISSRNALLKPLGLEHLRGFDGNLSALFENLDVEYDEENPGIWRNQVNQNAAKAIEIGGSTALIDITELTDDQAGHFVLKTAVVESREREYTDIRLAVFSNIVDLREVWYTAWGFQLLKETKYWIFTRSGKKTQALRDTLREAGLNIRFVVVSGGQEWPEPRRMPTRIIRRYIHQIADRNATKSLKNPPLKLIRDSRNKLLQSVVENLLEEIYLPPIEV